MSELDRHDLLRQAGVTPLRVGATGDPLPPGAMRIALETDLPDALACGEEATVHCRVTNRGGAILVSAAPNPVHLGSRWRSDPDGPPCEEGPRARLPHSLPPGQTVGIDLRLTAPRGPGTHQLEVSLVQEHVAWFADVDPSNAVRTAVVVSARRGEPRCALSRAPEPRTAPRDDRAHPPPPRMSDPRGDAPTSAGAAGERDGAPAGADEVAAPREELRVARKTARAPALAPVRRAAQRARGAEEPPAGHDLPMPSPDLRWRVAGSEDAEWFHRSGQTSRGEIESALALVGVNLAASQRSLEFGCGCGRILRWMRDIGEVAELIGTDIDGEAIAWAQANLPWARTFQNPGLPPLDFPDEHFDVIFNHSVFTHLDERYQDAWLHELRRVTKPGGVLLLTVTGEQAFMGLHGHYVATGQDHEGLLRKYREEGIVFIEDDMWKGGPFPDFYHSTFHAPWYVFKHWGELFTVEAYLVRRSLKQDQILLRRR